MKYKYLLTTFALAASLQSYSAPISKAEARIVARTFLTVDDQSSDEVAQSPYYVFSRGAGKGYIIVSGDDSTAPILGYTEQGDFVYDSLPDPLKQMLTVWSSKLSQLQAGQTVRKSISGAVRRASARLAVASFKSAWQDVATLVKTHWHQSYPYNMLAPYRTDNGKQAMTGCEATAASQIVYYFHHDNPSALQYNTPTYSYGGAPVTKSLPKGTPVRYDLMKLSGSGTLAQDSAVAILMYAVGTSAWLTYGYQDGTATAGNTDKMGASISGQFGLTNTYASKSSYSQTSWETLVYKSLLAGKPILYSGSNTTSGGHAVVLDGYQASTGLYHFNFGWGGQADGYYTIDDETGMNGFSTGQEMLVNITPSNPKMTGRFLPTQLYDRSLRPIKAMIHNDGTLPQQNFYLYCTYTATQPTQASASETATIVSSGDSAVVSFNYTPQQRKPLHLFLYNSQNQLLDTLTVTVQPTQAALHLNRINVDASNVTSDLDGIRFQQVNNTSAKVNVNLTNGEGGTFCQPIFRCSLFEYDTEAHAWKQDSVTRAMFNMTFNEGQTRDTAFVYTGLKDGGYYKARMVNYAIASTTTPVVVDTPDSIVYFHTVAPSLTVTANGRIAQVTGAWDSPLFIQKATDARVTTYDMTQVSGLGSQPEAANSNAVFFAANTFPGSRNVVSGGVCDSLLIQTAYEFWPSQSFTARKASLVISAAQPGQLGDVAMPFAASVPQGMQVKRITNVERSKIDFERLTQIPACTPVLYLTDYDQHRTITATDVAVTADSIFRTVNDSVWTSTLNTSLAEQSMLVGSKYNRPYYVVSNAGTAVSAFSTVVRSTQQSGYAIFTNLMIDPNFAVLADSINSAFHLASVHAQDKSAAVVRAFRDSIQLYENAFTDYTYTTYLEGTAAIKQLAKVMQKFLDGTLEQEVAAGIQTVSAPSVENADERVVYYSLDGQQLAGPRHGLLIIKRGTMVRKVFVK